jgi:Protein of unknown function (DUF2855)
VDTSCLEGSPHRAGLSSVYNVYTWAPDGRSPDDDALVVLRPVFWLSFTLDDHLAQRAQPDQPVIVTSASSKAALGLARLLTQRGVPVTGLTSPRHLAFAEGLKAYDQVLGYDQIGSLPAGPATLADIAGDPALREAIEEHLGRSAQVVIAGGTHGQTAPLAAGSFSAPDRIRDRARDWGWATLEQRYQAALTDFAATATTWLDLHHHRGLTAAARLYHDVLTNATPPTAAHLIDPTPTDDATPPPPANSLAWPGLTAPLRRV